MLNILFVCTGNTCRSPMAACLLNARIAAAQLGHCIQVGSAGIATADGLPASAGANAAMAARQQSLAAHRSRQLTRDMAASADLVLTMTESHRQAIVTACPELAAKVHVLPQWVGQAGGVADPYGGDTAIYLACAAQLDKLVAAAWEKIRILAGKKGCMEKT